MVKTTKIVLLSFWCACIVLPILTLVMYPILNYSGFCFEKMRYLGRREKFRLLFEMYNSRDTVPIKTKNQGTQYYKQVKYESFKQFMKMNPNCCAINPGGPYDISPPRLIDRITGYHNGQVIVRKFTVRYLDEKGNQKSQTVKFESVLQNCGKLKH